MKQLIVLITITLLLFVGVVSAQTIDYNSTFNSIEIQFNPALVNSSVYFNNELITSPVSDSLIVTGLEAGSRYPLIIESGDTGQTHSFVVNTESYKVFSVISDISLYALLLFIAVLLYLSKDLPIFGYVGVILSMLGLLTVLQTEQEFLIILMYIVAFLGCAYNIVYDRGGQ